MTRSRRTAPRWPREAPGAGWSRSWSRTRSRCSGAGSCCCATGRRWVRSRARPGAAPSAPASGWPTSATTDRCGRTGWTAGASRPTWPACGTAYACRCGRRCRARTGYCHSRSAGSQCAGEELAGGAGGGGGPGRRSGVGPVPARQRRGGRRDGPRGATHASAGDDDERAETGETGPPPWAHGHAGKQGHGPGAAWKALSPTQRSDLMKRLTTRHAQGMKAFGACVKAGRSDCEKPLPPGLAKRL